MIRIVSLTKNTMGGQEGQEKITAIDAPAAQKAKADQGFQDLEDGKALELKEGQKEAPKNPFEFIPGQTAEAATKTVAYIKTLPKYKAEDTNSYSKYLRDAISDLWAQHKKKYDDAKVSKGSPRGKLVGDTVSSSAEVDFGDGKVIQYELTSSVSKAEHSIRVRA